MSTNENKQQQSDVSELAQQLPKELKPSRDLWAGIEQAIAQTPQQINYDAGFGWQHVGKIAAAFAPIALVLGIWLNSGEQMSMHESWLNPVVASYEIQKQQLLHQVSSQPSIVKNWQSSMQELELAEKSLIQALKNQPEDPALMKMLNNVYQSQLSLIKKSHQPQLKKYNQI